MSRRLLVPLFICVLLASSVTLADSAPAVQSSTRIASQGETVIVGTAGRLKVEVRIKAHEVPIGKPSDPRPTAIEPSCTYSKYPCSIVDRLDITVNGKPLFVPRSAFCCLADLNTAEIIAIEKGAILTLNGGDASESYIAKIEFNATDVKRRILSSATEPSQPLEETIYHVVVVGD
jgi:hypothetical protein